MFKTLIVEDETDKLRDILTVLSAISNIDLDSIDHVIDAQSAKIKMKEKHYDLLILDISIPARKIDKADPDGGLLLLDEILSRDIYHIPVHIIGLTAYEESFIRARARLENNILTVIQYSLNIDDWKSKLLSGISQRILAKNSESMIIPDYIYDVAIICALHSELTANLENGWKWEKEIMPYDDTIYFKSSFKNNDGREVKIIAANAIRMGMPSSSALAMKLILSFRPKYLLMTGIMAGVSGRVNLSDLVVAHPVWDWGSGKWISKNIDASKPISEENSVPFFETDPFQFSVDTKIHKVIDQISNDSQLLYTIRSRYKGTGVIKQDFSIHKGAVASGASVLSDKVTFSRVKDQHRKLLGVEMEAFGVFSAVESASHPKPLPLCIKAVVDYGDKDKGDNYQEYGAFLSAHVAKAIIERLDY